MVPTVEHILKVSAWLLKNYITVLTFDQWYFCLTSRDSLLLLRSRSHITSVRPDQKFWPDRIGIILTGPDYKPEKVNRIRPDFNRIFKTL